MPNWCTNTLIISGDDTLVMKLKQEVRAIEVDPDTGNSREFPLSLQKIVPMPHTPEEQYAQSKDHPIVLSLESVCTNVGLNETEEQKIQRSWYGWRVAHWGTKWDLGENTGVTCTPGFLIYDFDSAWSPPSEAVAVLAAKYPQLMFRHEWHETGNDVAGYYIYEHGVVAKHEEGACKDFEFSQWQDEVGDAPTVPLMKAVTKPKSKKAKKRKPVRKTKKKKPVRGKRKLKS